MVITAPFPELPSVGLLVDFSGFGLSLYGFSVVLCIFWLWLGLIEFGKVLRLETGSFKPGMHFSFYVKHANIALQFTNKTVNFFSGKQKTFTLCAHCT